MYRTKKNDEQARPDESGAAVVPGVTRGYDESGAAVPTTSQTEGAAAMTDVLRGSDDELAAPRTSPSHEEGEPSPTTPPVADEVPVSLRPRATTAPPNSLQRGSQSFYTAYDGSQRHSQVELMRGTPGEFSTQAPTSAAAPVITEEWWPQEESPLGGTRVVAGDAFVSPSPVRSPSVPDVSRQLPPERVVHLATKSVANRWIPGFVPDTSRHSSNAGYVHTMQQQVAPGGAGMARQAQSSGQAGIGSSRHPSNAGVQRGGARWSADEQFFGPEVQTHGMATDPLLDTIVAHYTFNCDIRGVY